MHPQRGEGVHSVAARYLHLAVEAVIGIANRWNCAAGRGTTESNRDSLVVLCGNARDLDPARSKRVQGWAGCREVIVHDHLTLDYRIVRRKIRHDLGDLDAFRQWTLGKLGAG